MGRHSASAQCDDEGRPFEDCILLPGEHGGVGARCRRCATTSPRIYHLGTVAEVLIWYNSHDHGPVPVAPFRKTFDSSH